MELCVILCNVCCAVLCCVVLCCVVLCCVALCCSTLSPSIHLFAHNNHINNNNNNNNIEKRTGSPLTLDSKVLLFHRTIRIFLSSLYKRSFTSRIQIIPLAGQHVTPHTVTEHKASCTRKIILLGDEKINIKFTKLKTDTNVAVSLSKERPT